MDGLLIPVGEEDLRALRTLADSAHGHALAGTAGSQADDIAEMAAAALRDGIALRLRTATQPLDPSEQRPATLAGRMRTLAIACLAAAIVVVLVGGYGARWSWTGFTANKQVWDWLQLLLLPVALGTFPLWLRYSQHMSRARKASFGAVIVAFAVFVALGYLMPLDWTGFRGNTLWDWITLLLLPLALATGQAWPASQREVKTIHIVAGSLLGVAWLVTVVGGYAIPWQWTGYQGNTLWDWLQLLLAPSAVTLFLVPAAVRWLSGDVVRIVKELEEGSRLG